MAYETIRICVFVVLFHSAHPAVSDVYNPRSEYYYDTALLYETLVGPTEIDGTIMGVLINRTNVERQEIKRLFKALYQLELVNEIDHRLFGDFRKVMVALTIPLNEYDAHELYYATIGFGTDEKAVTEIMVPMNNSKILAVKVVYKKAYKYSLEVALEDDTSGPYKDFLMALCLADRDENDTVSHEAVLADAYILVNTSDVQNNVSKVQSVLEIFTKRSFSHLKATFEMYKSLVNKDIMSMIENLKTDDDFKYALQTVVSFTYYTISEFYARLLNDAVVGIGTNDLRLIRIIIARSEIDLDIIQEIYLKLYGRTLISDVEDDTFGAYKESLVNILKKY